MSKKSLCTECEIDLKEYVKLCLKCHEDLKNEKYNDFAYVMATLNNALHNLLKEKEELTENVNKLNKELDNLKLSKVLDINN